MAQYEIGKLIRLTRNSHGHTLETLSEGVCSPQTLYRIEKGRSKIKKEYYAEFMKKTRQCEELNYALYVGDTPETMEIKARLNKALAKFDWDSAGQLYQMISESGVRTTPSEQYLLRIKCILNHHNGILDDAAYLEELEKILNLTVGDYKECISTEYPFRSFELGLLLNIAAAKRLVGDSDDAECLLRYIVDSVHEGIVRGNAVMSLKATALRNLAYLYYKQEELDKGISVGREAVETAVRNGLAGILPIALEGVADKEYHLSEKCPDRYSRDAQMRESQIHLRQAYYIARAHGDMTVYPVIKRVYEEKYGVDISTPLPLQTPQTHPAAGRPVRGRTKKSHD